MKKATSKSTAKTPAPAKKAIAKPAAKPAAALVKPVKPAASPKVKITPAVAAPLPKTATAPAPVLKTALAPVEAVTVITAQIDIGFGNALYLRGEGPGLSWEKGVPLDNVSADLWSVTLPETTKPLVFKFLVNDLTWSTGEDYVAAPGSTLMLTPTF